MRKHFLFIFFFFLTLSIAAQPKEQNDKSNWSFTLETGINQFDGDMNQNYNSVVPNADFRLSFGGSFEYNFSPTWGLGFEFFHLPLSAKQANDYFTSNMNHANAYISINMLNLFSRDIDTRWGLWATIGGGLAFYTSKFYRSGAIDGESLNNGLALTVPVGAILEYNYTKSIALGTKLQYRSHNKDNVEGATEYNYSGVTNDFISLGTVFVRWKFNANKKDHARNVNEKIYQPEEAMIPARQAKAKADSLQSKVDSLRNEVNQIKPKIEKIEKILDLGQVTQTVAEPAPVKVAEKPLAVKMKNANADDDGDGVPNMRDKELNTPKNTPVDYWGRAIHGVNINGFGTVYFGFNKTDLDQEALDIIKTVAVKMNTDPTLLLEIRGFADNVGNVEYNQRLSQNRANVVKDYIVRVFKVSPDRIIANGKGKIIDMLGANRMNRRCNFYFNE